MSKAKPVERSERPLAKTVLAKLVQIGEPTRSIYANAFANSDRTCERLFSYCADGKANAQNWR
jgi:hypothetical protein